VSGSGPFRALVVLADGAQAAFAAGAVATLAGAGARWGRGVAAGLGAQVALLALAGEATEAERRWRRQAETGCPLLRPRLARERERLAEDAGLLLLPDPWRAEGRLDVAALREHLAPERGGWRARLRESGTRLEVGVMDLRAGAWRWLDPLDDDGEALIATATFAGGWSPLALADGGAAWGGAAALAGALPDLEVPECEVVCGFPVPCVGRGRRLGLDELIQARDEAAAAAAVTAWAVRQSQHGVKVRVLAPQQVTYAGWTSRPGADLALEWPLPAEHNAELTSAAVAYGRHVAGLEAVAARR